MKHWEWDAQKRQKKSFSTLRYELAKTRSGEVFPMPLFLSVKTTSREAFPMPCWSCIGDASLDAVIPTFVSRPWKLLTYPFLTFFSLLLTFLCVGSTLSLVVFVMQMLDIYLTYTNQDLKQVICLHVEELLYLGSL